MRAPPVAVVGVGTTHQGELPGKSADTIAVEALRLALSDAQLEKGAIDGLITCRSYGGSGNDTDVGRLAGLSPRYSASLSYGTCNFSLHLAVMAIQAGLASVVAIMYGTNQRTVKRRFASSLSDSHDLTAPYGYMNVAGPAALAFRRHQQLYGTTEEQLGYIAVTQRKHAQLNPLAIFREPLSIEDYLKAPYMVQPLRRHDLTMISDGGACLILAPQHVAERIHTKPISVIAMEQGTNLRELQVRDALMRTWLSESGDRLYAKAGVDRQDIDVLYIQDPSSVWVLQMLELFGFCEVGEGGPFVEGGERIALDGVLPINTNGGQLSEAYMWGWLHLCEAVRQLRGGLGARQVLGAEIVQYSSVMGFQKGASTILSRS